MHVRRKGLILLRPFGYHNLASVGKQFNIVSTGRVNLIVNRFVYRKVCTFRDTGNVKKDHNGSSKTIIGPYFFEKNERAVTVSFERYVSMIEEFFLPKLEEMDARDVRFLQNGTTAHTT